MLGLELWGIFGPVPDRRALIQIYQSSEDFQNMYSTTTPIVSLNYSEGKLKEALMQIIMSHSIRRPLPSEISSGLYFYELNRRKILRVCIMTCFLYIGYVLV